MKLETTITLIHKIAEFLNTQIELAGAIKPNNRTIWHTVLHNLTNDQWHAILETLQTLINQNPTIGTIDHIDCIEHALKTLNKYQMYDKCLDIKNATINNKPIAWKALMTVREVYNQCTDIHIPNHDSSRVTNTFKEIVE